MLTDDTLLDIRDRNGDWIFLGEMATPAAALAEADQCKQFTVAGKWPAFEFLNDGCDLYARFTGTKYGVYDAKKAKKGSASFASKPLAQRIHCYLLAKGPQTAAQIAEMLKVNRGIIATYIREYLHAHVVEDGLSTKKTKFSRPSVIWRAIRTNRPFVRIRAGTENVKEMPTLQTA